MLIIGIGFLLLALYFLLTRGLSGELVFIIVVPIGVIVTTELCYRYLMNSIVWLSIEGEWIHLVELNGITHSHRTVDVAKIIYTFIGGYRILIVEEEGSREYKCSGALTVKKFNEKHRGVWLEDFPGAEFVS